MRGMDCGRSRCAVIAVVVVIQQCEAQAMIRPVYMITSTAVATREDSRMCGWALCWP